jgi:hypothetical protein
MRRGCVNAVAALKIAGIGFGWCRRVVRNAAAKAETGFARSMGTVRYFTHRPTRFAWSKLRDSSERRYSLASGRADSTSWPRPIHSGRVSRARIEKFANEQGLRSLYKFAKALVEDQWANRNYHTFRSVALQVKAFHIVNCRRLRTPFG